MRRKLRWQLTWGIVLVTLITIFLISILANILINHEFSKYAAEQRKIRSQDIISSLSHQYDCGEWDVNYVHGMGMYALYEGYVIKLYDKEGALIWDAENHDMSLCGQIMTDISKRMQESRPYLKGGFSSQEYVLTQKGEEIGTVVIHSYGPYFFSENEFHFLTALHISLLVTSILSLLVALLAGWILARRIADPIVKTVQVASQISAGNYKVQLDEKAKAEELETLAKAMNHMAFSLEQQDALRKRLLTDVAHELYTPLSVAGSHLELILEGIWEPTKERLQDCYEEINRISSLIAEIETLSQVENDNLKLNRAPIDLFALAEVVTRIFESESVKKGISFAIEGDSVVVTADNKRLYQVMVNLLSNAVKYTAKGGRIRIVARETADYGVLTVADNGIGIAPEDLPLIFERFYRTDKSRSHETGGAGIGLTIVKSIVDAHGGKIEVESQVGQGSQFHVFLPKEGIALS